MREVLVLLALLVGAGSAVAQTPPPTWPEPPTRAEEYRQEWQRRYEQLQRQQDTDTLLYNLRELNDAQWERGHARDDVP